MGRSRWTQKLNELNSLGAGPVRLSVKLPDPEEGKTLPAGCTLYNREYFTAELPIGRVDPGWITQKPGVRYSRYDKSEGIGYTSASSAITVAEAVRWLWEKLVYELSDERFVVVPNGKGSFDCVRFNRTIGDWEFFVLPEGTVTERAPY